MLKLCPTVAVSLYAVILVGCDGSLSSSKQSRPVPTILSTGARFELVGSSAFGVALDTKTGQLCHTYNENIDTFVPATGTFHITGSAAHPSLDSIPLCIDLSQNEAATVKQIMDNNQKDQTERDKMQQQIEEMRKQLDVK